MNIGSKNRWACGVVASASLMWAGVGSAGVITFDPADGFALGTSLSGKPTGGSPQWVGDGSLWSITSLGGGNGAAQSDATSPAGFASTRFTPDAAFLEAPTTAATGQMEYSFLLRNDATPDSEDFAVAHRIWIAQDGGNAAIRINIFDNGQIELATGSGGVRVVNANDVNFDLDDATGRFIEVSGIIDFDTSTYTLSFDGVTQTSGGSGDFAFNSAGQSNFGQISLQQGGSGDANARQISIDDLSIAVPEPGSMFLLGLGTLAMLRRKPH